MLKRLSLENLTLGFEKLNPNLLSRNLMYPGSLAYFYHYPYKYFFSKLLPCLLANPMYMSFNEPLEIHPENGVWGAGLLIPVSSLLPTHPITLSFGIHHIELYSYYLLHFSSSVSHLCN